MNNKQKKFSRQKDIAKYLILALGVGTLFLMVFGCLFGQGLDLTGVLPKPIVDEKLSLIKTGELRDDVIKKMPEAWHHGECKRFDGGINDVFLFGPKELNRMDVLVVNSQLKGGEFRVVDAYPAENYLLKKNGYDKCIPAWILTPIASQTSSTNRTSFLGFK